MTLTKPIVFLCSLLALCYADGGDSYLLMDTEEDLSSILDGGNWRLGSGAIARVGATDAGRIAIFVDGIQIKTFEEDLFVRSVSSDVEGQVLVFLVCRLDRSSGGEFYSRLSILFDQPSKSEEIFVEDMMKREELMAIDGKLRFVEAVGSIVDFPNVDLLVAFGDSVESPVVVLREWQEWDVIEMKFRSSLTTESAIRRMKGDG